RSSDLFPRGRGDCGRGPAVNVLLPFVWCLCLSGICTARGRLLLDAVAVFRGAAQKAAGVRCKPAPAGSVSRTSELQATLAGSLGQRLHAAVVAVARAVEGDLLDAGGLRLFGDGLAHLRGGF